ncbi:MAG TPA: hypothetical protein VFS29_08020 [Motilibacteraceae bacterium]|nr:hypothetical protein [Motilibacteraceae bacterium]
MLGERPAEQGAKIEPPTRGCSVTPMFETYGSNREALPSSSITGPTR